MSATNEDTNQEESTNGVEATEEPTMDFSEVSP